MRRRSGLFVCAALSVLTSCHGTSPTADTQKAASTPSHALPTATEEFRLRGECLKLGKKMLAAKEKEVAPTVNIPYYQWTYSFSEEAHYDPRSNRCYVELDKHEGDKTRPLFEEFDRELYDGQTEDLLAVLDTVPENQGIPEKHFGTVYVDHQRTMLDHLPGQRDKEYIKAEEEDTYRDTRDFIDKKMADDHGE